MMWSSDNSMVASVDEYGNVMAMSLGTAMITASCGEVSAYCIVTVVETPAESIQLNFDTAILRVGEVYPLAATVLPENATDKTIVWSSDNSMVATVDENGTVVAMSLGTAIITASCGEVSASCMVTVIATPIESIVMEQDDVDMVLGQTVNFSAIVYPENATDKTLVWSSSDQSVVIVYSVGNVTAIGVGEADVIATAADGSGVSAVCHVTVNPVLVESILLTPDNWSGEEGGSFQIEATVLPENATDKALWWSSSDESVAIVDGDGYVTVLKDGSCVITATAADGSGIFAECMVTGLSGIDAIFTDGEYVDIYNLNGILIRKDCDKEYMKRLTPDIYIIRQGNKMKKIIIH